MSRYAKEHKEDTRQGILRAARRMLLTRGIEGTAIPALMGAVGLTHGGFYAHFKNKTELLAEVCAIGLRRRSEKLAAAVGRGAPREELAAYIDSYLNVEHRDSRASGCMLPALAGEISRQEPEVRHALNGAFAEYTARIAALMPGATGDKREEQALVLAAGMAGTLMMARTVDDPQLSDRILAAARDFYKTNFASAEAEVADSNHGRSTVN